MKKLFIILISLFMLLPFTVNALSDAYKDVTANIVGEKIEEEKINIYLFYSETCPHCHDEIDYLNGLEKKYEDKINIYKYEVTKNKDNNVLMKTTKSLFNFNGTGVPFTVIGEEYIYGYSESSNNKIEGIIDNYLGLEKKENTFNIPLLGEVSASNVSISLVAIILGFIDGFNPCAMWILLLLINMTLSIKNRKKMFIIGLTFILTVSVLILILPNRSPLFEVIVTSLFCKLHAVLVLIDFGR